MDTLRERVEPTVARQCLDAIASHSAAFHPEDRQLIQQIVGTGGTAEGYFHGGFITSVGIRAYLAAIGSTIHDFRSVLDFGCGSARVLRWFQDARPRVRLYGCDINPKAIQWCRQNAPFADFVCNGATPPLPYADGMFDFVYGISVFTHLDEAMQRLWLAEVRRITRPGGIVMLTVHGPDKAAKDLTAREHAQFRETGFWYKAASADPASVEGLPDFYQVAFHSPAYVAAEWSHDFDIQGYVRHGCMYAQDLVTLRAKDRDRLGGDPSRARSEVAQPEEVLPIGFLESPGIGSIVEDNMVDMRGWAFYPDGPPEIRLDVRIDGQPAGQCLAGGARPDVAAAFYTNPNAGHSGFSLRSPATGLQPGPHVLLVCVEGSSLPLCATYFEIATARACP